MLAPLDSSAWGSNPACSPLQYFFGAQEESLGPKDQEGSRSYVLRLSQAPNPRAGVLSAPRCAAGPSRCLEGKRWVGGGARASDQRLTVATARVPSPDTGVAPPFDPWDAD